MSLYLYKANLDRDKVSFLDKLFTKYKEEQNKVVKQSQGNGVNVLEKAVVRR